MSPVRVILDPLESEQILPQSSLAAFPDLPYSFPAGFEIRLAAHHSEVDYQQCFTPETFADLAGLKPLGELPQLLVRPEQHNLNEVWLEFDQGGGPDPSLFLGFDLDSDRQLSRRSLLAASQALGLTTLPASLLEYFSSDFPATVSHVGLMLGRPQAPIRVNLKRLKQQPETFLHSGRSEVCRQQLAEVWPLVERPVVCLDLDWGGQLLPRLGLECSFKRQPPEVGWETLCRHLVLAGLACPAKTNSWLNWPALLVPHEAWPLEAMLDFYRQPVDRLVVWERQISHLKITWDEREQRLAKCYFGLQRRVLQCPGQTQPSPPAGTHMLARLRHLAGSREPEDWDCLEELSRRDHSAFAKAFRIDWRLRALQLGLLSKP